VSLILKVVPEGHSFTPPLHHSLNLYAIWVALESPSPVELTGVNRVPELASTNNRV